jgi:hypothetical protein
MAACPEAREKDGRDLSVEAAPNGFRLREMVG